jgi:hypothetical protein
MTTASSSIVIAACTLLRANLFEAAVPKFKAADPTAKAEFSVWASFDASKLDSLRSKILAAVGLSSSRGYQMPFRDGNALDDTTGERKSPEYLRDRFHFTANTTFELGPKNVLIGQDRRAATPEQIYSGVIGAVLVTPKLWEYQGKKGVKLYLNAVLITAKGTHMSIGGVNAESAFGDSEIAFGELPDGDSVFDKGPF